MGKIWNIAFTHIVQIGANIKIFSAHSARFGAIIKFWDKIYTPAPDHREEELDEANADLDKDLLQSSLQQLAPRHSIGQDQFWNLLIGSSL